ncbi:MAG: hypothetical protein CMM58_07475 [Rhodospirillaceae bacterium]|nr:hypothetical protein [Rhodospirillaceae bacterium]|tara:strand:- start:5563 stop:6204 length:642 start_codon:yes stop_codon:yes gene_type:complete
MELDILEDASNLSKIDNDIADLIAKIGIPKQNRREPNFATLMHIIISQQISLAAADAIWKKLQTKIKPLSPPSIVKIGGPGLQEIGFTKSKAKSAIQLSNKIINREFNLASMSLMKDHEVRNYLTELPGIGDWSASIYLIFCLERRDVWPAGDIALQESVRHLKKLDTRPKQNEMRKIGYGWKPWRSAAALLLWHYYSTLVRKQNRQDTVGFQ